MKPLLTLLLLFFVHSAFGQQWLEVRGSVVDGAGQPLAGASIRLLQGRDSAFTVTNQQGQYLFTKVKRTAFSITASYLGLQTTGKCFDSSIAGSSLQMPLISLLTVDAQMDSIVIQSVRPVLVKEDTIQYDASAYKVREGAAAEEVIKKLPGVTVDRNGNIEAQGKKVTRVRVNGKDFFGGDVQTATQNLPADMIKNIQVIDDYGDMANVTGSKAGEPEKIININTKTERTGGVFGNARAAGGTEGRFGAGLFLNHFEGDRQVSLLGGINNTNTQLFGGDGGNAGGGAGISVSKTAGVNYRNKWGKKLSVYGSYGFNSTETEVENASFSRDINPQNIRSTQSNSVSSSHFRRHRLNLNAEYSPDSLNYIKFAPYWNGGSNGSESAGLSEISRPNYYTFNENQSLNDSRSNNGGANLLYNHRFHRRGRNLSTNFIFSYNSSIGDRSVNNEYLNIDSSSSPLLRRDTTQLQSIGTRVPSTQLNAQLTYSEPLNVSGSTVLEFMYDWRRSQTENDRDVYDYRNAADKTGTFNDRQSNHYTYSFTTNRAGLSVRGRQEKYNYSIGLQVQPSSLQGKVFGGGNNASTRYTNVNWVPAARFVYQFARNNSITATIDGNSREPGFFQLQPVADSSNLNNIVVGNPALVNEFTNTFGLRYNRFDAKSGASFFVNLFYHVTNDKIVSSRFNNPSGTGRITTYQNTDGFYNARMNASATRPFVNRRYTAGLTFNMSYDNNVSFNDGQRSEGSNWNFQPGANFRLDINNQVDLMIRGDYTIWNTTTRYKTYTYQNEARTLHLGINGKNYFGDLTIGYEFTQTVNYGLSSSVAGNPALLSCFLEYQFLQRRLAIRMQGFDLLNRNVGINRVVNETTIIDSRTSRLGQYFLLSANMRLSKFARGEGRGRMGGGGRR